MHLSDKFLSNYDSFIPVGFNWSGGKSKIILISNKWWKFNKTLSFNTVISSNAYYVTHSTEYNISVEYLNEYFKNRELKQ